MSLDRIKGGLESFVRSLLARVDYFARYPAKVVQQNPDGSLELQPDDPRIPAHSKVPIRLGLPDATVKVLPGARVLLGFAGGLPSNPIAELWESGSVTELSLNGTTIKLNGGSTPVAKEGSISSGHSHVIIGTAGPYPISAVIQVATDTIASGAGSPSVRVP